MSSYELGFLDESGDDVPYMANRRTVFASFNGGKRPKNRRERKAHAKRLTSGGHIVNPLGKVDTRPKRIRYKSARDIGPTGNVTTSQLMKHLVKSYEAAFGESIEDHLPTDTHSVQSWFDNIKQRYLETNGATIDNRGLSEYFSWLFDPKRHKKVMSFYAISGMMYLRRYYDEVVSKVGRSDSSESETVVRHDRILGEYQEAYSSIGEAIGDGSCKPAVLIMEMVDWGIPMVVQCLRDKVNLPESECVRRVTEAMSYYYSKQRDKDRAESYLRDILKKSEQRSYLYTKSMIWGKDGWRESCSSIIEDVLSEGR